MIRGYIKNRDWTALIVAVMPFLGTVFAFIFVIVMVLR